MDDGVMELIDTVIIGNGPSALILSYILHGHIPKYNGGHSDKLLDRKLAQSSDLLKITPDLYDHFRSSLNYSSQALPVNTLFDTLLRPNGDTDIDTSSCVEWHYDAQRFVPHIVLGNASSTGGQWAENPVAASWDIGTLSYAEQLSLPGYTMAEYWLKTRGEKLPELIRPTRRDVADYFAAYPVAVGIEKAFRTSAHATSVSRTSRGFDIAPHNLTCTHLVLATGIYNLNIPPPPFLQPLLSYDAEEGALLVVGSGFTAADIIISTPPSRKIIHLYNWDPTNRPSPLKACHGSAYPEYAWIYRQMKGAADRVSIPKPPKSESLPFIAQRNWSSSYEGFPNARVLTTSLDVDDLTEHRFFGHRRNSSATSDGGLKRSIFGQRRASSAVTSYPTVNVTIGRSSIGEPVRRTISSLRYAAGRRGSLSYLDRSLLQEVLPRTMNPRLSMSMTERPQAPVEGTVVGLRRGSIDHDFALQPKLVTMITGDTLRGKIEGRDNTDLYRTQSDGTTAAPNFEVAANVFAIGSLTGDSLVRFAFGGCAVVAGKIINGEGSLDDSDTASSPSTLPSSGSSHGLSPSETRSSGTSNRSPQRTTSPTIKIEEPKSSQFDRRSSEHERKAGPGPYERRSGSNERRSGQYDRRSGQFDRSRIAEDPSEDEDDDKATFSVFTMMQKRAQRAPSVSQEQRRTSQVIWE